MPPLVLDVAKIVFLALLYFFVYRAIRWMVIELRAKPAPAEAGAAAVRKPLRSGGVSKPGRGGRRAKPPKKLVIAAEGKRKAATLPLEGALQVGRADECDVRLDDTYVSQFHARIFNRDGAWFVEDLGSTNGTFLNDRKVTSPAALSAGDRVRAGRTVLEIRG